MAFKSDREQFIFDVFVTALEGDVALWANIETYRWSAAEDTGDLGNLTASVVAEDTDEVHVVNAHVIRKGLAYALTRDVRYLSAKTRDVIARASRANDASEIDADIADVVVQIGLFGEVRYS